VADDERFCEMTATVDGHTFVSPDGNDYPTLTCCRPPGHDGLHHDEVNLIAWEELPPAVEPWQ
jgi:hypothetical protein